MLVMSRKSCDLQMPKVRDDGRRDEKTRSAKQGCLFQMLATWTYGSNVQEIHMDRRLRRYDSPHFFLSMKRHHQPYLNVNILKERYKHLEHVEVQLVDGPIDLLIGQDCPSLLRQLEVRYGGKDEPYAVRTPLGWSICGPLGQLDDSPSVHLVCSLEEEPTSVDYTLRKFWEIETIAEDVSTNSRRLAEVQDQTQKTTVQVGNRYQVRLPWKQGIMKPTGSYDLALRRLHMTEKKAGEEPRIEKEVSFSHGRVFLWRVCRED